MLGWGLLSGRRGFAFPIHPHDIVYALYFLNADVKFPLQAQRNQLVSAYYQRFLFFFDLFHKGKR